MKEFNVNGAVVQCYPLTAAQRIHNYTIKFSAHQVLNIGTGFYIQLDLDFDLLKQAVKAAYQQFDSMRIRFVQDEDETVYQYIVPNDDREIPVFDFYVVEINPEILIFFSLLPKHQSQCQPSPVLRPPQLPLR